MKISGAEILIKCLKKEGVKHIFGYPGGVVLNIFDSLYDEKDIQLFLTQSAHLHTLKSFLLLIPKGQTRDTICPDKSLFRSRKTEVET